MTAAESARPRHLPASTYRTACEELVQVWESQPTEVTARARQALQARVIYGLALHVVSTTGSVLLLTAARRHRDAYPLVRKCLEFAVMAQWLGENERTGLQAFGCESTRRSRAMLRSMEVVGLEVPADILRDFSIQVPKIDEADIVRNFEHVCRSFRGGEGLYLMYRSLSAECHPSISAVSMMLPDRASDAAGIGETPDIALFTCALSAALALRAADEVTPGKPMKRALRSIGKQLSLPTILIGA